MHSMETILSFGVSTEKPQQGKWEWQAKTMNHRQYKYTQLGMLAGLVIGGGIATILFVTSGNAVYFTITGIGLALGLIAGAMLDSSKGSRRD